jgi:hypothetical protein
MFKRFFKIAVKTLFELNFYRAMKVKVFHDKFQEDFKVFFPQKITVKEVFGR